ncbi:bifunctional [glutamine synthetase] adenylyltransferase/[glutamine synthetase]-adenylyl-L-tyrosine phosphorylase [Falsarthrobacter nasiphocae]|uniref:Glutamate-ammonia-ligase adenylyltransferase n=1 Tax=Falsarthrobacter nasiphocae TaxID=189863 RepID=A0AAE3YFJ3_9MICC|nr:bifunctional [glutamine synthetase] adenylyltransferase/[glutamine synthetase]-adenylyl-L-tyrosine phosphorylase [Falsarthrobacter nasiphocae]MDR6891297.1 glutamate-ammonia-ligase adenylyltransferase [Falsarthrobacter nasiphocae]
MASVRSLIAAGFQDTERASTWLASPELEAAGLDEDALVELLGTSARPDAALPLLVRLLERSPEAARSLGGPEGARLVRLLGASSALGDFLIRRPEEFAALDLASLPESIGDRAEALRASLTAAVEGAESVNAGIAALRARYRRHLVEAALVDVEQDKPEDIVGDVAADLADLAAAAFEAALVVARAQAVERFGADAEKVRLAVIAMGKCGARELNYISDVDVMYVVGESGDDDAPGGDTAWLTTVGTFIASRAAQALHSPGIEPGLWEVDANLRPEGKDGALVRTLDSYKTYYETWAHNWEFQALLKARFLAGDAELGERFEALTRPLVFSSSEREGFVAGVQAMRARVTSNIPAEEAPRQIKLGEGGLRDVEFTVQLLQLVHGRTEESLHVRDTLSAIRALTEAGFVGREDGAALSESYRFLRLLEHRLQLTRMRRTHLMPESEDERRDLARSIGLKGAAALSERWVSVKRRVRALHEQIFFRPILASTASLSPGEARLSREEAMARLAALGYVDPNGAMRHIEALTQGVSRRSTLQRQLLPVLLGWFAEGVNPDGGLLAFRRLSEALGESPWFLRMLRDSNAGAQRLCRVLSTSRLVADWLEFTPESVQWLGDDSSLAPRDFTALWHEIRSKLHRDKDPEAAARFVRLLRRREIMRIALADSSGLLDPAEVRASLSDVDRACVLGILHIAENEEFAENERLMRLAVIAMGRQGGREITYGSDADVLYVYRAEPGADGGEAGQQAERIVHRLQTLLTKPVKPAIPAELVLTVDAALRPEGRQGPLVRSLDSYAEYYERWGELWEFQALLRARPMAGDDDVAGAFMDIADKHRYPAAGLDAAEASQIRRIKARVEGERLPRGADPERHLKLGRGSLSDVEWLVQLGQLRWAHEVPALRTSSTLTALAALEEAGHMTSAEAGALRAAWSLASSIRSATMIYNGRATDVLPSKSVDLEAVARWTGHPAGSGHALEEEYLRVTRRARAVFESLFYG